MLKLTPLEIVIIGIPEALLWFLLIYSLARKEIVKKDYLFVSIFLAVALYLIRLLPINFGVHTLLGIVVVILLSVYKVKVPVKKAISYAIVGTAIIALCEELYMLLLIIVFKVDISKMLEKPSTKVFYIFPYLILVSLAVIVVRVLVKRKAKA